MKRRILVTGADGMLGVDLVTELRTQGREVIASTVADMDITCEARVRDALNAIRPDAVIHTAAYTAVDLAEKEKEKCLRVNTEGPVYLAGACRDINADLMYISTDYVFDGASDNPYIETDKPGPASVYGLSKRLGEEAVAALCPAHKICRTSWLIGPHGITGTNFVEKILKAARDGRPLSVVSDQKGRPTFTFDLARLLIRLLDVPETGVFHTTNSGEATWFDLARAALDLAGFADTPIRAVTSADFPGAAKRPANSLLDAPRLATLGIPPLRHWREALGDYMRLRKDVRPDD